MDDLETTPAATAADDSPQPAVAKRRRGTLVGSIVITAVLLGAIGGVLLPRLLHDQRVREYHAVIAESRVVSQQIAEHGAQQNAVESLLELTLQEATSLAANLADVGSAVEPILSKDDATLILGAATTLGEALQKRGSAVQALSDNAKLLQAAVQKARENAAATASGADGKTKAPEGALAAHWHEISVEDAARLSFPVADVTQSVEVIADNAVSGAAVETATKTLKAARTVATESKQRLDASSAELDELAAQIDATLLSFQSAAQHAPAQAALVAAASSKAGDLSALNAAAAAAAAKGLNGYALKEAVDQYISQAESALQAHADREAQEVLDAASASNGVGPSGPGTGTYVPRPTGQGAAPSSGWNGGNTGGGNAPGGGNAGSGVTPGGGAPEAGGSPGGGLPGGGYTPPPHQCPAAPLGWYASGSTGNGCPIYVPPGSGGADEW